MEQSGRRARLRNWLERNEPLLRTVYRLAVVASLVGCFVKLQDVDNSIPSIVYLESLAEAAARNVREINEHAQAIETNTQPKFSIR